MEDKIEVKEVIETKIEPLNNEGERTMNENERHGNVPVPPQATPHFVEKDLDISVIKKRDALRTRKKEDEANIEVCRVAFLENKIAMERNGKPIHQIPLIVVWYDRKTGEYVLLGGFHRLEGATRAGLTKIQVRVFHGLEADAYQVAIQDNNTHGLKLSLGDKKYTIEKIVLRFPDKPYREIARELKCSVSHVSTVANKLHNAGLSEGKRMRKTQNGMEMTDYQQNAQSSADAKSAKLATELTNEITDRIGNLLDGKSMREGKDLMKGLSQCYGRINEYIKEQALRNGNDAVIIKDQFVEAARK
jgi:hypothetical protein